MTEQRFVSYAQNMEDVMLWRALHQAVPGPGFYIDAGAADPTALSVTRAFYDRGWHGINIEALPEQAALLRQARPRDVIIEAALSEAAGPAMAFHRVVQSRQTGLSTTDAAEAERHRLAGAVVETIAVPVTTLAAVCRDHVDGPVHFLKVDVEGAEAAVLAGADFGTVRPWIVLVEATQPLDAAAADLGWEVRLLASGYRFVWFDGLNRFYLAEEHIDLERHFKVQPNVFDNYTVYDPPLQDHLAAVTALSERRAALLEDMQVEIADLTRVAAASKGAGEAVVAAPPDPAPAPVAAAEPIPIPAEASASRSSSMLRRVVRRGVMLLHRASRPVTRPLAWRFRSFLIGPLQHEMFENRLRLDSLVASAPVSTTEPAPALLTAMEDVLITLALERGRDPRSTFIGPATAPDAATPWPDRLPKTMAAR